MSDVEIINTQETNDLDNNGRLMRRFRVKWRTADDGPFVDYFPVENFNGADARRALEARARQMDMLRNK